MPTVKATGQISIIDYNDAISLSGYIGSNHPKYQIYSPDTGLLTPDWSVISTNLVLTPELYVTGTSANVIESSAVQSVTWYENSSTTAIVSGTTYVLSGTKNHILTVKQNRMSTSAPGISFRCEIVYQDATTGLSLTEKMDISFTLVTSGNGIADALASTPDGNIFKNGTIQSLRAECYLWKGSAKDETNVTYQWYVQDSSVVTDQGGGVGWKLLSNTANVYSGVTTATLTVYAEAVTSLATYQCVITDTDASNAKYRDFVTFVDLSDPIQVTVESSGGDVFKNGVGSTVLTARLFQAGAEIDTTSPYTYTYKWYKYDKNATLVTNWGGSGVDYQTGKTLNIGSSDVDVKATFKVEIE